MSSSTRGLLWSCFHPPPLSLSYFLCLSSSVRLRASLLSLLIQCWKMSSQILLERILADGLKHKWWGGQTQAWSAQSARLYDCQCVCASLFAVMHRYVCAWAWLCLESHKRHQSCQRICITSKNRGHAMLIYYLPIHAAWRKLMQRTTQGLLFLE